MACVYRRRDEAVRKYTRCKIKCIGDDAQTASAVTAAIGVTIYFARGEIMVCRSNKKKIIKCLRSTENI